MPQPFDTFILLAEMRTGSNFLESSLNSFPNITCHGEAFNPHFIGYPNRKDILGVTQTMRDADPKRLIEAIERGTDGIGGFRFFHDHDARALDHCLHNERCAKVILTRNPVESYVSWKIAQETGQWKLTNVKHQRSAKVRFDLTEFNAHLDRQRVFREEVQHALQISGQTAFYVNYADLNDVDVLNGLARFLGETELLEDVSASTKKQNPAPLSEKLVNFEEMESDLSSADYFDLSSVPNFEPKRGPMVPGYVAASKIPLLFLPIAGRTKPQIVDWMTNCDGGEQSDLLTGFTQKTLRQWKRQNPGHRSFTVVSHPAARAHAVFCHHILNLGPDTFTDVRDTLRKKLNLPLPAAAPGSAWNVVQHRAAFIAFLEFVKKNIAGQTSLRVHQSWASQSQLLQGMTQFAAPDMILRTEALSEGLAQLSAQIGVDAPDVPDSAPDEPFTLDEIYDQDVELAARAAYQRDYMSFGYGAWA